jgi:internalin A
LKSGQQATVGPKFFVSYAWDDGTAEGAECRAIIVRLCAEAVARGITIVRDETALAPGDRVSKFIECFGRADRLFAIISGKYLTSPYCMRELFEVRQSCRKADEEFLSRIRVFTLPSAKIWTTVDRALYAVHWRMELARLDALVREHDIDILGENGVRERLLIRKFAHETADILATVADVLQPRDFDEFVAYGFNDRPPDAPLCV